MGVGMNAVDTGDASRDTRGDPGKVYATGTVYTTPCRRAHRRGDDGTDAGQG
jgi:hypothetical protein